MSLLENYRRAPVTFVAGEGCELIDGDGRRYLDMIGGIAVCALGHAHPSISQAVAQQARTLVHVSNLFHHEPAGELAEQLATRSGFERVFFCNSGTEANEAAIKLARKYAYRRGETQRNLILSCTGAFHGRTMGALAATPNPAYHEGFAPLPDGFRTVPFNDVSALRKAITDDVTAFIVEPVQGESGVVCASADFLSEARELCDAHGVLLIFDEVQCGMGRLGPLFAFQAFGVQPDVVTLAKALANGLPIGAMLVREQFAGALRPGDHGSTFGGSPVSCAAALAHLRLRDELKLESRTASTSVYFFDALRRVAQTHPAVFAPPRGMGLLLGLPVHEPNSASEIVDDLRVQSAILANAASNNTIRFAPPLIVERSHVDRLAAALIRAAHRD